MRDAPLVVGLDCSTHGAKAVAFGLDGAPAAEGRAGFDLLTPAPGWYEQRAAEWERAALDALAAIGAAAGPRVRAIGITHQRETFVPVDAAGGALRAAIVWMDERAFAEVEALRAALGEDRFHAITGKPLAMTPSVTKILWLRAHEPAVFAAAARWLDVGGYLARALTGADVTSVGSAEPMGLVDLRAGRWSDAVLAAAGLAADRLPALLPVGAVAGGLTPAAAARTGLAAGTPVVVTAGDGQVAALGAQVFGLERAYLNLGTAIVAGTVAGEYRTDRAFRTMAGALPGTFLLESDLKGGTFTLDWLRERVLGGAALADLEAAAAAVPAGSEGLVLVPYLATVMNPYWDDAASGILVGLRGAHGPGHLMRAALEGIALEERLHLDLIGAAAGQRIAAVHVLGGGAASDLWCQILADALDRPVTRARTTEATALGAAMLAAAGAGLAPSARGAAERMGGAGRAFTPGPAAPRYARLFEEVYRGLYPALRDALGRLAAFTRGG
ncbi:MAG TPA: FGGY family carbohydrate kinase [Polyangia bacterium]|jgi:xylulokinase